ncbi:MAG: cyclic nucleotide-binding domain-containing protein [Polyangiaceae bacterium]
MSDARLPPVLSRIAMKAMATDPAQRYAGAAALKADLEGFLRGGGGFLRFRSRRGAHVREGGRRRGRRYVLEEGLVEVFKTVGDTYVPLRLMGPGEVFGEAAVFSSKPRSASVVAKSDVVVRVITAESLERELSKNVSLKALVRALAHRFRELDAALVQLQVEGRGKPSAG